MLHADTGIRIGIMDAGLDPGQYPRPIGFPTHASEATDCGNIAQWCSQVIGFGTLIAP